MKGSNDWTIKNRKDDMHVSEQRKYQVARWGGGKPATHHDLFSLMEINGEK
ncbi:MAG: hypothetical protein N2044_11505 [Cyclobacteriaceae bacterium]|nr:hypothetical protein [Cyclobacteriaceae bacterium]